MRRTASRGREAKIGAALVLCSLLLCFVALEAAARIVAQRASLWRFPNYITAYRTALGSGVPTQYDARLGWVPRANFKGTDHQEAVMYTADAHSLRQHNYDRLPLPAEGAILAVGDSYTEGGEVEDNASWPAHLERLVGRRVINGGVGGYGIDQIVLRAETLVGKYRPDVLVVGLIADDVDRARMRILWGLPKPYFEIENGKLALRNVPLAEPDPNPRVDPLRRVLGYSYLMDVAMRRLGYMAYWRRGQPSHIEPAHDYGDTVACLLMDRLAALRDRHKTKVVLVAQYSPQTWEAEHFRVKEVAVIRAVADCARARGIDTIDTYPAVATAVRAHGIAGSYTGIHMNPAGNRLTAAQILDWLKAHP